MPRPGFSAGDFKAAPAGGEIAGGGFAAGADPRLNMLHPSATEVARAHHFFQAGSVAGAESAAAATMHAPVVPPGGEPVSPLIQMMMRLPGMAGLMDSFFDFLNALFSPDTWLNVLDPSHLMHVAQDAATTLSHSAGEHMAINPALLPKEAPIFRALAEQAGRSASFTEHGLWGREGLNCGGTLDLGKPQFETGREIISGPHMTSNHIPSVLAGAKRLFSDKIGIPAGISGGSASALGMSQSVPIAGNSLPSAYHVGSTTFGQGVDPLPGASDAAISGPDVSPNVSYHLGASGQPSVDGVKLGPSGAVSGKLGTQRILPEEAADAPAYASDSPGGTYVADNTSSSAGGYDPDYTAPSESAESASSAPYKPTVGGLKAKPLPLSSIKGKLGATTKPVMDHIGHAGRHHAAGGRAGMDQISHRTLRHIGDHGRYSSTESGSVAHRAPTDRGSLIHRPALSADRVAGQPQYAQPEQAIATEQIRAGSDASAGSAQYTIRSGDCLWNIAKNHLGDGMRWKEIYNLNAHTLGSNPHLIRPGVTIELPGADGAAAASAAGKYIVKAGDNLWDIARTHLGDGSKWGQIYQANTDVVGGNPRLIFPGQELTLPGTGNDIACAQAANGEMVNSFVSSPNAVAQPASHLGYSQPASSVPVAYKVMPADSTSPAFPPAGAATASYTDPSGAYADPAATQGLAVAQQVAANSQANSLVSPSLKPDLSFIRR